ncbi:MAG: hypothetical protein ACE5ID_03605, partial [Acidobacteriota bacterium]
RRVEARRMSRGAPGRAPRRLRNVHLVRQPDRVQTGLLLLALALGAVVLVPLLANIWGHAEAVRLGYLLEAARNQQARLVEQNRLLRIEDATLRERQRIQKLAMEKPGLVPRRADHSIIVTQVETPGEPAPDLPPGKTMQVAGTLSSPASGGQP